METIPNATVTDANARAAMGASWGDDGRKSRRRRGMLPKPGETFKNHAVVAPCPAGPCGVFGAKPPGRRVPEAGSALRAIARRASARTPRIERRLASPGVGRCAADRW